MTNILVPKLLGFANFFPVLHFPPFSVAETLHVSIKSIKYKEKILFGRYSSRELITSEFSLLLHARENSDVFNTLDGIYLVQFSPQ